jgi:hypothetical protein
MGPGGPCSRGPQRQVPEVHVAPGAQMVPQQGWPTAPQVVGTGHMPETQLARRHGVPEGQHASPGLPQLEPPSPPPARQVPLVQA